MSILPAAWCASNKRCMTDVHAFSLKVSECLIDVASWMRCNQLQLNPGKTELLWCSTDRRRHRLPTSALAIGSTSVPRVSTVRDLGILVHCDLVMRTHVCRTVSYCFAILRQLLRIRYLVSASSSVARHCSGPLPSGLR